jgi:hypothetical protein
MAVVAKSATSSAATTLSSGSFVSGAGDLLHAAVSWGLVAFTSITSSPAQTWTNGNAEKDQTNIRSLTKHAMNITGSATQTVTLSVASSTYCSIIVLDIPGMATSAALDVADAGTAFAAATTFTSGAFTTTSANETIVGTMFNEGDALDASYTAGGSYTIPTNGSVVSVLTSPEGACEFLAVTSIQTGVTLSMTGPHAETGVIFVTTYKQAGGGGATEGQHSYSNILFPNRPGSPQPVGSAVFAPVRDQAKGSPPFSWSYPQNFSLRIMQQSFQRIEPRMAIEQAVGSVTAHWPYPQMLRSIPPTREPTRATEQAVSSVTSRLQMPAWTNRLTGQNQSDVAKDVAVGSVTGQSKLPTWITRLFGSPGNDKVITVIIPDGSMGGVNRTWGYRQAFQQPPQVKEDTPASEGSPVSSVNRSWNYPQNFTAVWQRSMATVMDGAQQVITYVDHLLTYMGLGR